MSSAAFKLNLFNVQRNRRQLSSYICFHIQSLVISCLSCLWRKFNVCNYKRKDYYSSFSRQWYILFFDATPKLNKRYFLCCINLKHIKSISCSLPWKSIGLCCTVNGSFTHEWSYNIIYWSGRKCCVLHRSSKCWHILLHSIKKFYLLILLPISSSDLLSIENY